MVTAAVPGKADGNELEEAGDVVTSFEEDGAFPTVAELADVPAVLPPPPPQAVSTLAAINATAIGLISRNCDWFVCAIVMGRFVRFMFYGAQRKRFPLACIHAGEAIEVELSQACVRIIQCSRTSVLDTC